VQRSMFDRLVRVPGTEISSFVSGESKNTETLKIVFQTHECINMR
jgi:hypothetical protein